MLNVEYIRNNAKEVKINCQNRNIKCDIDNFLQLDDKRKEKLRLIEELKLRKNKINQEIIQADNKQAIIIKGKEIKKQLEKLEPELKVIEEKWLKILMEIPNIASPNMPIGKGEEENVVIKKWGNPTKFDFTVKNHIQIGEELDIIDIKKAAQISGSRFFYLKNEAVWLQFAIINFVFSVLGNKKILRKIIKDAKVKVSDKLFVPILPPVMIRDEVQKSIHRVFGDQTYRFEDDNLNLVASAEHTLAPYHMGEIVDKKELPLRYIGYSTAFRREAGTYGKDMGGILRTHQFDKLEMESFTDAESGEEEQKFIVAIQEYLVQQIKIPYQLIYICSGDAGKPDYNQFDIECWLPGQNKYRETHTSDYMTDYQMRGIKSFYKDSDGKNKLLHTNDATAFAIGRILIAIIENYQQKDGSIIVPKVLRKWMPDEMEIIKRKK